MKSHFGPQLFRFGDFQRAVGSAKFKRACVLEGEVAKRPPRGFPPDHRQIDDIRRKDFVAVTRLTEKDAIAAGFLQKFATSCRAAAPLNAFLCKALGHAW